MFHKRSLRSRAIAYLSRREHSRNELARKLAPFVEETDPEDAITSLLDALDREGWLSDTRFAESVVNRRGARFGAARIVHELKQHQLDPVLIGDMQEALRDREPERAHAVWQKKFGRIPDTPQERAKQIRFMASRGFSSSVISRLLRTDAAVPDASMDDIGDDH